jgi:hypothetical protein
MARVIPALLLVVFLLPVLAHVYAAHYTRYIADDYCVAEKVASEGVIGAHDDFREHWSGRFTYFLVTGALMSAGVGAYSLVPSLLIVLWLVGLWWALAQLAALLHLQHPGYSAALLSAIFAYTVLEGTPNIVQSVYWVTAATTYLLPVVLFTFYAGLTIFTFKRPLPTWQTALSLVLGDAMLFAAVGFSETYAALQIAALGVALVWAIKRAPETVRRRLVGWLIVGMVCSLVSVALVMIAPGNAVRAAMFPPRAPPLTVAWRTIYVTLAFVASAAVLFSPLPLLVSLLVSGALGYRAALPETLGKFPSRRVRPLLALSAGIAILLVATCIFPSIYVLSVAPPTRIYMLPLLAMAGVAMAWGLLMGMGIQHDDPRRRLARSKPMAALLALLIAVGPAYATIRTLARSRDFATFAAEWDARDQMLRQAAANGATNAQVARLSVDMSTAAGLESVDAEPAGEMNGCAARYYGLASLVAQ